MAKTENDDGPLEWFADFYTADWLIVSYWPLWARRVFLVALPITGPLWLLAMLITLVPITFACMADAGWRLFRMWR